MIIYTFMNQVFDNDTITLFYTSDALETMYMEANNSNIINNNNDNDDDDDEQRQQNQVELRANDKKRLSFKVWGKQVEAMISTTTTTSTTRQSTRKRTITTRARESSSYDEL